MKKFLQILQNAKVKIKEIGKENALPVVIALSAVLFAVLITDLFYRPKPLNKRGFEIEVLNGGKIAAKKEEKPFLMADLFKTADFDRGAKIFKKCASCHNIAKGESAKVGPNLYGVVGRAKASFAGFSYSQSLKEKGGVWDRESISQFITKPKDYLPGTKMAFPGLKKPQDRADVIFYLEKQK